MKEKSNKVLKTREFIDKTLEQKLYFQSRNFRDKFFKPLVFLLNKIGMSPDFISTLSILLMVWFVFLLEKNLVLAGFLVIILPLLDGLDGALARSYGQLAEVAERGKFVDLICGLLAFIFMVFGLVRSGFVLGHLAVLFVSFLLLSKIFRAIVKNYDVRTNWRFRAVAGFLPTFFMFLSGLFFVLYAFWGLDLLNEVIFISTVVLLLDAFHFYYLVLHKK